MYFVVFAVETTHETHSYLLMIREMFHPLHLLQPPVIIPTPPGTQEYFMASIVYFHLSNITSVFTLNVNFKLCTFLASFYVSLKELQ